VEREAFACAVMAARMEARAVDQAPIWTDIKSFPGRSFSTYTDMVIGGIPCQDFSVAGKRGGTGGERWLWPDFWRIVRETNAQMFFLENVPGFVSGGGLAEVLSVLAGGGWDARWNCFSASEVGAPHRRERLFLLAVRNGTEWHRRIEHADATGGAGFTDSRENMADAVGCRRREQSNGDKPERQHDSKGGIMANTDNAGLQGRELSEACDVYRNRTEAHGSIAESGEIPVWPPGPNDHSAWRQVMAIRSDLMPSLGGKLNHRFVEWLMGIPIDWTKLPGESNDAHRIDRLRCLGNAVVPATAELAFRTLFNRCVKNEVV